MQGEGAASEIARAIKKLDHSGLVDVIIVARGGGSLEDLWAFNEEEVVKAVFACSRPVISGVGHEVDITLCDLAADVRAPTPTAAAEMVVPHVEDLRAHIDELVRRLADTDRWYQPRVQRVDELSLRLRSRLGALATEAQLRLKAAESALVRIKPHRVMELLRVKLGTLDVRLTESLRRGIRERALGVDIVAQRLARSLSPETLRQQRTVVESLAERLSVTRTRIVDVHRARFESAQARLESVSPQAVLNRGFSIVYSRGAHVRSVSAVAPGDPLDVRVADGVINSIVGSK